MGCMGGPGMSGLLVQSERKEKLHTAYITDSHCLALPLKGQGNETVWGGPSLGVQIETTSETTVERDYARETTVKTTVKRMRRNCGISISVPRN